MPTIKTELWLKRDGARYQQLEVLADSSMQIKCTNDAEIKMALSATVSDKYPIDYLNDRVVPIYIENGTEYFIGEYIITDSTLEHDGTQAYYNINAFDLTYLCRKYRIERRLFYSAGTRYTEILAQLLTNSGITNYYIQPTNAVLQTDREDWEPGTTYISIINTLLLEINYNTVYMDLTGRVNCTAYRAPTVDNIDIDYTNDANISIIVPGSSIMIDAFEHPNVFYYVVNNAEYANSNMVAVAENNDPVNIFSTVNQGRVVEYTTLDNVASQSVLQTIAARAVRESMLAKDIVSFTTGINTNHNPFSIVSVKKNEFTAILAEQEYTITLGNSPIMQHSGRRIMYAT